MSKYLLVLSASVSVLCYVSAAQAASNDVWLDQIGPGHTTNITQTGVGNFVGNADLHALQNSDTLYSVNHTSGGNQLTIDQNGNGNLIGTDQWGSHRTISQLGQGNTANLKQTGDANLIGTMVSSGWLNDIKVDQNGDGNLIGRMLQYGTNPSSNKIDIKQYGDSNGYAPTFAAFNFVPVIFGSSSPVKFKDADGVIANPTESYAMQAGAGNNIKIRDYGDSNSFFATQSNQGLGGPGNSLASSAIGYSNFIYGYQSGTGNDIKSWSWGAYNALLVNQGSGLYTWAPSLETGDQVLWNQVGYQNHAEVNQTGSLNNFSGYQFGAGNGVVAQQLGGGDVGITHQWGGNNNTTLTQNGASNFSFNQQFGFGNTANITQN